MVTLLHDCVCLRLHCCVIVSVYGYIVASVRLFTVHCCISMSVYSYIVASLCLLGLHCCISMPVYGYIVCVTYQYYSTCMSHSPAPSIHTFTSTHSQYQLNTGGNHRITQLMSQNRLSSKVNPVSTDAWCSVVCCCYCTCRYYNRFVTVVSYDCNITMKHDTKSRIGSLATETWLKFALDMWIAWF